MSFSMPILFFTSLLTIRIGNLSTFDFYLSVVYEIISIIYIVCCIIFTLKNHDQIHIT